MSKQERTDQRKKFNPFFFQRVKSQGLSEVGIQEENPTKNRKKDQDRRKNEPMRTPPNNHRSNVPFPPQHYQPMYPPPQMYPPAPQPHAHPQTGQPMMMPYYGMPMPTYQPPPVFYPGMGPGMYPRMHGGGYGFPQRPNEEERRDREMRKKQVAEEEKRVKLMKRSDLCTVLYDGVVKDLLVDVMISMFEKWSGVLRRRERICRQCYEDVERDVIYKTLPEIVRLAIEEFNEKFFVEKTLAQRKLFLGTVSSDVIMISIFLYEEILKEILLGCVKESLDENVETHIFYHGIQVKGFGETQGELLEVEDFEGFEMRKRVELVGKDFQLRTRYSSHDLNKLKQEKIKGGRTRRRINNKKKKPFKTARK